MLVNYMYACKFEIKDRDFCRRYRLKKVFTVLSVNGKLEITCLEMLQT